MRVVDVVHLELGLWVGKVKLLAKCVVIIDILSSLNFQVKLSLYCIFHIRTLMVTRKYTVYF